MFRFLRRKEAASRCRVPGAAFVAVIVMAGLMLFSSPSRLGAQDEYSTNSQPFSIDSAKGLARLPAGTRLTIKMIDPVNSAISRPGDRFRGSLEEDLMAGDVVVARKGTVVFGSLRSDSPGTGAGPFRFVPTDIVLNGQMYPFKTSLHLVQAPAAPEAATGAITGAEAIPGGISETVPGIAASGERVNLPAGTLLEFALDFPFALPVATK